MIKKVKKLVATMLAIILVISTISPITAQANSLPEWFNNWADFREWFFGWHLQICGKAVSREKFYEYFGYERVKDPDKLTMDFNIELGVSDANHRHPITFEVYPQIILMNKEYDLPIDVRKWLEFRVYDDKGNMIIRSKRVKKMYAEGLRRNPIKPKNDHVYVSSSTNSDGSCYFNWYTNWYDEDLSHLRDGVYTVEWRCNYKDIKTKWEKVPVVTVPFAMSEGYGKYRWFSNKYVKSYDVYIHTETGYQENMVCSPWKKLLTTKKHCIDLNKCGRKYLKAYESSKYEKRFRLKVVPKAKYKGKTLKVYPGDYIPFPSW